MKLQGRIWFTRQGKNFLGKGRVELLQRIGEMGSIAQAAKAAKMSYKAAWDAIDAINNTAKEPLVIRVAGGVGGGGTKLTEEGLRMIRLYQETERKHKAFLEEITRLIETEQASDKEKS